MLSLRKPTVSEVDRFVRSNSGRAYNTPLGIATGRSPRGWFVDEEDAILGVGPAAFDAAQDALLHWEQMDLPWFRVHRPGETHLAAGEFVTYSVRIARIWMTFACRIVSVFDETDPDGSRRFGYVYATVAGHPARGEEQFMVYMNASSGEVHGSIRAVSQPARWFTWAGLPVARQAQHRFKPAALAALAGAVRRRVAAV